MQTLVFACFGLTVAIRGLISLKVRLKAGLLFNTRLTE